MNEETEFQARMRREKETHIAQNLFSWVESFIWAVLVIAVLLTFFIRPFGVVGSSMEPTLQTGNRVILSSFNYKPQRGDIVVSAQPNTIQDRLIKRVIAVGGDTVDIDFNQGVVYINGKVLEEKYVNTPTTVREDFVGPITIPKGKVFLMGDNRNASSDSRTNAIGLVDENYIVGKVILRIYPFGDWLVK